MRPGGRRRYAEGMQRRRSQRGKDSTCLGGREVGKVAWASGEAGGRR